MLDSRLRGLALYMYPGQGHCAVLMGKVHVLFFLIAPCQPVIRIKDCNNDRNKDYCYLMVKKQEHHF